MFGTSTTISFQNSAYAVANYACSAFTYGATAFSLVRTAALVAAFPLIIPIGMIAGAAIRYYVTEYVLVKSFGLCCPCNARERFKHRLVGVLTSIVGIAVPLQTIDPIRLSLASGWMLINSYKECFFTNASLVTKRPSPFAV